MDPITATEIYNFFKEFGFPALLVYAILRGWIVPLTQHQEMKEDRDWWRDTALGLLNISEKTVDVAERVAKARKPVIDRSREQGGR